ncbi:MAG: serine/threonine-protein phosphatase [Erysipelotrichaceae bacterium]|nr:serine/threonine-protein phosphatase [Erysipelotrichaceae bacterium]
MTIYALTEKSPYKTLNEDRIIIGKSILADGTLVSDINKGIFAVADGVGGNNAGEKASSFVSTKLVALNSVNIELLVSINNELLEYSNNVDDYHGMATTLSGICINDDDISLFNVGNSRTYIIQNNKYLKQLTEDDTTLNFLLKTGQLDVDNVNDFNRKNEITACFGGGNSQLFKIKISSLKSLNSPILITSDGIHDYLSIDEIEDIIIEFGISLDACKELKKAARNAGSTDDISVILGGF